VPILFNLEIIGNGGTSDNLINVIIHFLVVFGGMPKVDLANKVVYFQANNITTFQGLKTNM
jgi:hypothetical protein